MVEAMRWARRLTPMVLVATVAASSVASAQPRGRGRAPAATPLELPANVETAEQLYAQLDYEKANQVAERVVAQRGLSHDDLVRAHRVLAVTHAILGDEEAARDAFLDLLVFDPDYSVDTNLGPKVSAPFLEARARYRALPSKPGLEVSAHVRTDGGRIRFKVRDPLKLAKRIAVGYRWTSSGEYTVTEHDDADGAVEVTPPPRGRARLDYYAQALDARDSAVFEAGNPEVPRSAFAEASAEPKQGGGAAAVGGEAKGGSIFSSPVFWVIAGAAVVGGGSAVYFATRPDQASTQAALTPVLRCGPDLCN